ncbi:methylmalonyl-CoA mutase subunit beta [Croceivirga sp. JEA036]|uniref:methylmalonyl-CoA mutase subunit beta n=1 Tax=Croceivirga sp. JEA036 TaxID=2721162 RepID=UPI00143B5410|nr:methylmalonyl-CoA mutase subunit beta [Croceivirga sp. JEA036]NJB37655.1 methylmalonyl-CoA mutase [Croceivirga sp. JEA036]
MDQHPLFDEFSEVSAKQWKQKIQVDLKGADYNDTLVWETLEGIKVKPFYSQEDLEALPRYKMPKKHQWRAAQHLIFATEQESNSVALKAINNGAQEICISAIPTTADLSTLLKGINKKEIALQLGFTNPSTTHYKSILEEWKPEYQSLVLTYDPIGQLAETGNWSSTMETDLQAAKDLMATNNAVNVYSHTVNLELYQNAGANCVQQLAYGLAHASEYLNLAEAGGQCYINFNLAIGGNYFFEIAKLRALRWLLESLQNKYEGNFTFKLTATPTLRNKTIYDYNVNMLRTTVESMAAVLGGADTIINTPYDTLFNYSNEFGDRIARNQLLLLKEEAYLDEALHATDGTYYIEVLTYQLAQAALDLWKQLETSGGFLANLKKGILQKKIKAAAQKEQSLFDAGQLPLIGTNVYQNPQDKMKASLQKSPFMVCNKRKTLLPPILRKRLAETVEQNRLKDE